MHACKLAVLGMSLWCFGVMAARADDQPDFTEPAYNWQKEAQDRGLSAAAIKRLDAQKLLITSESFRQSFEPYANPSLRRPGKTGNGPDDWMDLPPFITSDAVLNVFHILFEESVTRMERLNAVRLAEGLKDVWKELPKVVGGLKDGDELKSLSSTYALALHLLGEPPTDAPPAVAAAIKENLRLVEAGAGVAMPAGAGPADENVAGYSGVDFARLKPRGFYSGDAGLAGYFRAVAWLQEAAFRAGPDHEVIAAYLVSSAIAAKIVPPGEHPLQQVSRSLDRLVGPPSIAQLVGHPLHAVLTEGRLDNVVVHQVRRDFPAMEEDRQRFEFRLMSFRRLPERDLFRATTVPPRLFPSGLDLLVAMESEYAEKLGSGEDWPLGLQRAREHHRSLVWNPRDGRDGPVAIELLPNRYLYTLAALLDPADEDCPAFMQSDAWKTKQCQAVLGGWAQWRHTWVLQGEETVGLFGGPSGVPGFVEPVPEFWQRLEELVVAARQMVDGQGVADGQSDRTLLAAELRAMRMSLEVADLPRSGSAGWEGLPTAVRGRLESLIMRGYRLWDAKPAPNVIDAKFFASSTPALIQFLEAEVAKIAKGEAPHADLVESVSEKSEEIRQGWNELQKVCRTLETLSHKQLRKVAFKESEAQFITDLGTTLGRIAFHNGPASAFPKDNAPRIATIHSVRGLADRPYLHVGVGRPREILVLYPWKGKEVLCRGAVMPYYEFRSASRLTDLEWKAVLDSDGAPALPGWTEPLYRDGAITKPK